MTIQGARSGRSRPVVHPAPRHAFRRPPRRANAWLWGTGVALVYTALSFGLFRHTWADPSHRLIGWCCDAASSVSLLRVTAASVVHLRDPLLGNYLATPHGFNLMWQPSGVPLAGVVATPLELLFGAVTTYNVLATLAIAVSGLACYVALRRWVGGVAGPFVGGLLYEFSPYMAAHSLGHLNFTLAFVPPLFFSLLGDLATGRRSAPVAGVGLGLLAVVQLLLGQELLVGTVIFGVVVLVVLALSRPSEVRARLPALGAGLAVAAAVFGLVGGAPLAVQVLGPERFHGLLRPQNTTVTDLANVVLPTEMTQIAPPGASAVTRWGWEVSEMTAYVGPLLLVVSAVIAAVRWRSLVVRGAVVGGVGALVLSLGPSLHVAGVDRHIPMPWALVGHLPVLENILPARFALFLYLGLAVVVAEGVATLIRARRWWTPVGLAAIGVALVPLVPLLSYPTTAVSVPTFFADGATAVAPGDTVFVAPVPRDQPGDIGPVLWQAATGDRFKMEGGYVLLPAPTGPGLAVTGGAQNALTARLDVLALGGTNPPLQPGEVRQLRTLLEQTYRPAAVIVGPMAHGRAAIALFTEILDRPPVFRGGVALWLSPGG